MEQTTEQKIESVQRDMEILSKAVKSLHTDLENVAEKFQRFAQDVTLQRSIMEAQISRLHFMQKGLPLPNYERIFCRKCGKVLGKKGEPHECVPAEEA